MLLRSDRASLVSGRTQAWLAPLALRASAAFPSQTLGGQWELASKITHSIAELKEPLLCVGTTGFPGVKVVRPAKQTQIRHAVCLANIATATAI